MTGGFKGRIMHHIVSQNAAAEALQNARQHRTDATDTDDANGFAMQIAADETIEGKIA